ncbi:hypothetical protein [Anabaena sp. CCY 9402-a]|uniref:hypothetical protein n=1 Tax=Anabaena sp. CCY 9402-a TaxID=3103867 RepID=UPI0039C5F9B0
MCYAKRQAVRMIVSLGGFLGNRGENPFGVGCGDYHDIAATQKLFHSDFLKTSL